MWILDDETRKTLPRVLAWDYYTSWIKYLENILSASRTYKVKRNRWALLFLQEKLAEVLTKCGAAVSEGEKQRKIVVQELEKEKDTQKINKLKEKLENHTVGVIGNKQISRIARTIGDGIAWRSLDFDRPAIRLVAQNKSPGRIDISKIGFTGVKKWAVLIANKFKDIVIINDLTNFLRVGDLTEIGKAGVLMHEIKKGGKRVKNILTLSRDRQHNWGVSKQSLRVLQAQLAFDHRKIVSGNSEEVSILDLELPYNHKLEEVLKLIKLAKKSGYSQKKFGNHLFVSCTDLSKVIELERKGREFTHKDETGWSKTSLVFPYSNYDTFYEKEGDFVRNMTPYSVFPFPTKICLDLMSGNLLLVSKINLDAIKEAFRKRDWKVVEVDIDKINKRNEVLIRKMFDERLLFSNQIIDSLFVVKRGRFNLNVSSVWIMRTATDFMTLDTLLEQIESIYQTSIPDIDRTVAPNLINERMVWK